MKQLSNLWSMLSATVFPNPFEGEELVSSSTGLQATKEVEADLILAKERGTEAMNVFHKERLSKEKSVSFFDTNKKLKLETFAGMSKRVPVKVKDKTISLNTGRALFSCMAIIVQKRCINLKEIFCFPLGPIPWSLADTFGNLQKTNKQSFSSSLPRRRSYP